MSDETGSRCSRLTAGFISLASQMGLRSHDAPNHALQRTTACRRSCKPRAPWPPSRSSSFECGPMPARPLDVGSFGEGGRDDAAARFRSSAGWGLPALASGKAILSPDMHAWRILHEETIDPWRLDQHLDRR